MKARFDCVVRAGTLLDGSSAPARTADVAVKNGLVAESYKADINVIDASALRVRKPEVVFDLPGGGRRLEQCADGYVATMVGGETTYLDGEATGALPGHLLSL